MTSCDWSCCCLLAVHHSLRRHINYAHTSYSPLPSYPLPHCVSLCLSLSSPSLPPPIFLYLCLSLFSSLLFSFLSSFSISPTLSSPSFSLCFFPPHPSFSTSFPLFLPTCFPLSLSFFFYSSLSPSVSFSNHPSLFFSLDVSRSMRRQSYKTNSVLKKTKKSEIFRCAIVSIQIKLLYVIILIIIKELKKMDFFNDKISFYRIVSWSCQDCVGWSTSQVLWSDWWP